MPRMPNAEPFQDKKRCILIPVFHGFSARLVFQTDVIKQLTAQKIRLVLLIPPSLRSDPFFSELPDYLDITTRDYEIEKCKKFRNESPVGRRITQLKQFILNGHGSKLAPLLTPLNDKLKIYLRENATTYQGIFGKARWSILMCLILLGRRSRLFRRLILFVEEKWFAPSFHQKIFNEEKPDLVLTTSLGIFEFDEIIMREARKNRVPVTTVVLSWDNTAAKGMIGARADRVIAWTETMKNELTLLNDVPPSRIDVVGPPQFDHYWNGPPALSRESLCQKIGADPKKKILLLGTKSPNTFPWNPDIATVILRAIRDKMLPEECQLVVRLHPIYYTYIDEKYVYQFDLDKIFQLQKEFQFLIVNSPVMTGKVVNYAMPKAEIDLLHSLLYESAVIVNIFSTLNIEASILNKPVINIAYPGKSETKKPRHNLEIDLRQVHNLRIIASGGASLVRSDDELVKTIGQYLRDPSLHQEGRRKIVETEAGVHHGDAGRVIGKLILEHAGVAS